VLVGLCVELAGWMGPQWGPRLTQAIDEGIKYTMGWGRYHHSPSCVIPPPLSLPLLPSIQRTWSQKPF
jgi:hypothetical protein